MQPAELTAAALAQQLNELQNAGGRDTDPVQFRYLESLIGHLNQPGSRPARKTLERARQALARYIARMENYQPVSPSRPAEPSPLSSLLKSLTEFSRESAEPADDAFGALLSFPAVSDSSCDDASSKAPRELKAYCQIRAIRAHQTASQRIAHAIAQTPADAGPLNAHRLVTRAIQKLGQLSPEYQQHLVGFADTLLWLENRRK